MTKATKSNTFHNAHLLIPEELWQRAKTRAKAKNATITDVVVEALSSLLKSKAA